jgi:hypothetical protein
VTLVVVFARARGQVPLCASHGDMTER